MASIQEYDAVKVMVSDKVQATLSIKLVHFSGIEPAQIYGNINCHVGSGIQFSIFEKDRNQHIDVHRGESIPLSQSEVNVPEAATEMEIRAHLMKYNSLLPDHETVNGKVLFLVKDAGVSETKPIHGIHGSIEVNVLWG